MNKKTSDDKFIEEVMEVLKNDYDDNILYYADAENDVKQKHLLIDKLHNLNLDLNKKIVPLVSADKTTVLDFKNNKMGLIYNNPHTLLAYSLDFLSVRHVLPFGLSRFFDMNRSEDLSNSKIAGTKDKKDRALEILDWVKGRVLNNNFVVHGINVNRSAGTFSMTSMVKDLDIGNPQQYITVKFEQNKMVNILGENRKAIDWARDYKSLFSYFVLGSGLSQIFARCNCLNYNVNYSKKIGNANFLCNHLMMALTELPWYLMSALK